MFYLAERPSSRRGERRASSLWGRIGREKRRHVLLLGDRRWRVQYTKVRSSISFESVAFLKKYIRFPIFFLEPAPQFADLRHLFIICICQLEENATASVLTYKTVQ